MQHNNDFRYDLKVGQCYEKALSDILENKTIEVKADLQAEKTRNIFIEYESRGKPSGIATSISDYYCIFTSKTKFLVITTTELKELCRKYKDTNRDKKGGDSNTSKGILLPIVDLIK